MTDREPEGTKSSTEREGDQEASPWWWRRLVDRVVETSPERRREVLVGLFPQGDELKNYLYRFTILQSLAVLIALFGLLSDSTAVVIGAMLVAPS